MLIVHNPGEQKPLHLIVVIPPKKSRHPVEAFVDLAEAMTRLEELPDGTRYASVRVKGDVLTAISRSAWEKNDDAT